MKIPQWLPLALAMASAGFPGLPAWAAKPKPVSACLVADFKTLALVVHDPQLRAQQALAWLQKNLSGCSKEQLEIIQSNSASWLGHALTPQISGWMDAAIEARVSGNPALMSRLYESIPPDPTPSAVVYQNPPPRAPIVRPPVVQGGIAGAVNYGNMVGPSTSILNQTGSQNNAQNSQQLQGGRNNLQQSAPDN